MDYQSDFLIIGSGVAGLSFALKVADFGTVSLVTKKEIMDSGTNKAQGGIASVFDENDSFELHIQDTLTSGCGLCREEVADMVIKEGPAKIKELLKLGVDFCRAENKTPGELSGLDLGREGGHSRKRIVHAGDMTGKELERTLAESIKRHKNISLFENNIAIDLVTWSTHLKRGLFVSSQENICRGAYVLNKADGKVNAFNAKIILLATGGAGKVYLYTSNPDIATGDGVAMGHRAGAAVANLEFVQFHPTSLYHPEARNFLISEAVRGENAVLLNSRGERFMENHAPEKKELACRDVVARAIDNELKKSGDECVFLDISHRGADFIKQRFPNLYEKCLSFGIDMTESPIPVVPAAHYMCGGVVTDTEGRSDIKRLYAVGETACTGLHGANRLASNSLLEALVYADRAAREALRELASINDENLPELPPWDDVGTTDSDEGITVSQNWDEIRRFMWNYVGIVRSDKRLARARRRIEIIQKEIQEYYWNFKVASDLIELRNIATVARLIIESAMQRKESRGLHYNIAYPYPDDKNWKKDTILKK